MGTSVSSDVKSPIMADHFSGADAWILLAIIYCGSEGERATISSIADGIDHSIPTEEELSGALSRLRQAGLVEEEGGKFKPTETTLKAYLQTHTPRPTVFKELEDIKQFLGVKI